MTKKPKHTAPKGEVHPAFFEELAALMLKHKAQLCFNGPVWIEIGEEMFVIHWDSYADGNKRQKQHYTLNYSRLEYDRTIDTEVYEERNDHR